MTDSPAALIRPAEFRDAERIARVHVDTWRETYSGLVPDTFFNEDAFSARKGMWTRYLSAPPEPGRLVVAERDGAVVGFAAAGPAQGPDAEKGHPPARSLQLFSIYLLAAQHGSGAGQSLLDGVLGDEPAQLWVARENHRARAFYERNGFEYDGVEFIDPRIRDLVELRLVR
ncbi:GNAT family N-acetyltransferase [Cryobacterium sp. Sr8]|uniref:GNAT family N-acetyltransferase n=1 Tax=Cryobacterium sp. Sr8 TaxID=1259203 RepID=UPI00106941D1|nr:GNAT family N-acetyltransferase [Cryobacterium sp. Sr8]TFD74877.1 GNAT family N-acetyltransferase [Cryobacterium sp. Sr8]